MYYRCTTCYWKGRISDMTLDQKGCHVCGTANAHYKKKGGESEMNVCFKCGAPATTEYCFDCLMGMVYRCPSCDDRYSNKLNKCPKCGLEKEPKYIETFGFDEALRRLKAGKQVKRKHWGGYWFIPYSVRLEAERDSMNPMIVASLKDDGGYVPAQPYMEDLLSEDWEEVE